MHKALKKLQADSYSRPRKSLPAQFSIPVSGHLSPELEKLLTAECKALNISKSWLVARALADFLGDKASSKELDAKQVKQLKPSGPGLPPLAELFGS